MTALHHAVKNGYIEIIELLLNHKNIDVNIKNEIINLILIKSLLSIHDFHWLFFWQTPLEITDDDNIKKLFTKKIA